MKRESVETVHKVQKVFSSSFFLIRVTRWGEVSPIGWLFALGGFLKITEVAQMYALLFPNESVMKLFWQKTGWATFWATFSQTHLVTLFLIPIFFFWGDLFFSSSR
jgi:hypothetical protein